MAAITICSDFGAQKNKVSHYFHSFPIYLPSCMWQDTKSMLLYNTKSNFKTVMYRMVPFVERTSKQTLFPYDYIEKPLTNVITSGELKWVVGVGWDLYISVYSLLLCLIFLPWIYIAFIMKAKENTSQVLNKYFISTAQYYIMNSIFNVCSGQQCQKLVSREADFCINKF